LKLAKVEAELAPPPRLRDVEQNLSLFFTVHSLGGLKALLRVPPVLVRFVGHNA
jgi:hypothetical protein